jgi:hypothetical protein
MSTKIDHGNDNPPQAETAAGDPSTASLHCVLRMGAVFNMTPGVLADVFDCSVETAEWCHNNPVLPSDENQDIWKKADVIVNTAVRKYREEGGIFDIDKGIDNREVATNCLGLTSVMLVRFAYMILLNVNFFRIINRSTHLGILAELCPTASERKILANTAKMIKDSLKHLEALESRSSARH